MQNSRLEYFNLKELTSYEMNIFFVFLYINQKNAHKGTKTIEVSFKKIKEVLSLFYSIKYNEKDFKALIHQFLKKIFSIYLIKNNKEYKYFFSNLEINKYGFKIDTRLSIFKYISQYLVLNSLEELKEIINIQSKYAKMFYLILNKHTRENNEFKELIFTCEDFNQISRNPPFTNLSKIILKPCLENLKETKFKYVDIKTIKKGNKNIKVKFQPLQIEFKAREFVS